MQQLSSFNLAYPKRFWCGELSFWAYQLQNHFVAFSVNQLLPNQSKNFRKTLDQLVKIENLQTIRAVLTNKKLTTLYPMATVKIVWEHFEQQGLLPSREKLLLASLLIENITDIPTRTSFVQSMNSCSSTLPAQAVFLEFTGKTLQFLIHNQECYISDQDGLGLIDVPTTFLVEIGSNTKLRILKRRGYTGEIFILSYLYNSKVCLQKARNFKEWIAVWSYFCTKGNTKACEVLGAFALKGAELLKGDSVETTKNR